MIAAKENQIKSNGKYRINDTIQILINLVIWLAVTLICFLTNRLIFNEFLNGDFSAFFLLPIVFIILTLATYRVRSVWKGIELDLNGGTIEFTGGGIAANDVSDYIRPGFFLQYFGRTKINLDHISEIGRATVRDTNWLLKFMNLKPIQKWVYSLEMRGSFGAATLKFNSEGKRDEIYSAIRQMNCMGTPVVVS